ncbi:hypothetical protein ANCDUO_14320 [Ancylostoma duodenale]|uniref:Sulfatase N-terminal domain-containing protein n=1 Tax=Ancylostoma duodenale TaxID=51022 RepID=A0A0C2D0F5_9BILA|nr:hypothetical protein ANCDUO_14320 [Ancylostoma duodenale]
MSWAVGEVLDSLVNAGIAENTLVILMSDHGPHAELCLNGGSTAGLKGGKSNSYEGGFRIPFIAWQPGTIKAGRVSNEVISSMDLYRTFRDMQNCPFQIPKRHRDGMGYGSERYAIQQNHSNRMKPQLPLDGTNIMDELLGVSDESPGYLGRRRPIIYYCNTKLMAIRVGNIKVHYKTSPIFLNDSVDPNLSYFCPNGKPRADWQVIWNLYVSQVCPDEHLKVHYPPLVFDLTKDPYERYPLEENDFVLQLIPPCLHATCEPEAAKRIVGPFHRSTHLRMQERLFVRSFNINMRALAAEVLREHRETLVPVTSQLGHFDKSLTPCCDPPACRCDKITNRQEQKEPEPLLNSPSAVEYFKRYL